MFNLYLGNNHLVGKCRWGLSRTGQIESNKKVLFATSKITTLTVHITRTPDTPE